MLGREISGDKASETILQFGRRVATGNFRIGENLLLLLEWSVVKVLNWWHGGMVFVSFLSCVRSSVLI